MSAGLVDLLGDKLLSSSGEVDTASALAGKAAVALYFSAHWCPPCRGFTPQLAGWYSQSLQNKGLEVVFVSSDKDEGAFKDYFSEQPWTALPYSDRQRKDELSKKCKVQGIPALVILDGDGNVINKDGRAAVSGDPTGEDFPWKPKTLKEILASAKIIGKDGQPANSALDGKVLALYFSAHWCGPCRGFTPQLAKWYSNGLKDKDFEIVFVSSDKDADAFAEYYAEQPWLALDFANRKEKEQLSNLFGVRGIPSLVIIDKDGFTITTEGRAAIAGDPEGAEFPWYPKPVKDLANGPGPLNESPVVIAFCEAADPAAQKTAEEAMEPLAKRYIEQAEAAGEDDPKLAFMIAKSSGGISGQIRKMTGLPSLPPAKHEHPLEEQDSAGGRWGCDGCQRGGPEVFASVKRFRCTKGCDFDFCEDCNGKAGTVAAVPPRLMLVNVPDNGGYFEAPEGDVNAATVEAFVAAFEACTLERKQLQK